MLLHDRKMGKFQNWVGQTSRSHIDWNCLMECGEQPHEEMDSYGSSSLSDSLKSKVVLWRWENPWENPTWRHNDVILWVSK